MKNKLIFVFFVLIFSSAGMVLAANHANKIHNKKASHNLSARTQALESQVQLLQNQVNQMRSKTAVEVNKPVHNKYFSTLAEIYAHGPAVVASPIFGLRANEDEVSPELMVNLSGINRDLLTLKLRQKIDNYASENNLSVSRSPLIVLSGGVEGQIVHNANHNWGHSANTNINLSRAELDIIGEVGPWVTAAMLISYDDKAGSNFYDSNVTRVNNSRLQVDRAWLTVGQLNRSPVYFTLGQVYAPFGCYSSFMITFPPTQILGKVKDRMAILGFDYRGFNGQIYGFAGETKTATNESQMAKITKHAGANLGYKYESENFSAHLGAGVIGNLAESEGMQDNIFGKSTDVKGGSGYETLQSRVPGYNAHVKFDIYDFDLLAEFVTAAKAFDPADLTFNTYNGAKPRALQVEGAYSFNIKGKPNTIFAGYSATSQALALDLPKQRFSAGYSLVLIKNTLASIEYRHDVNYAWTDSAGPNNVAVKSVTDGRHKNTVILQLGAYF